MKKCLKKKLLSVGLAWVLMMALAACGSSSPKSESAAMDSAPMANGTMEYAVEEFGAMPESELLTESADVGQTQAVASDRKLIKTVDMQLETQTFDALMQVIQNQVTALGGYVEHLDTYNGSAYYDYRSTRNASMTIRIPKDRLDTFLNKVSENSNVVSRSDSVEDVTLSYVDMQSRRDALEIEQSRLLSFLEQAETIEDIITIEQRLSDVRYQLESMESQLRTLDNQVDYSTVYLNVEEVEIYTPVEEETAWERMAEGFKESIDNICEGFVEFVIWLIIHIPYILVWVAVNALIVGVIVWAVKRSSKKKEKTGKGEED